MNHNQVCDVLTERLRTAGVEGVQAINPPEVRIHPTHWSLVLDDGNDAPRAVYVLRHIPGVNDIGRARRITKLITFTVERNAVRS